MSLSCRSCLTKNENSYFSLLTVFSGFGEKSILDLLNMVTSSKITYSERFPREICLTCFKDLKNAYNFINLFKKSQAILQKNCEELPEDYSKVDIQKNPDTPVLNEEDNFKQILKSDDSERIVIINDDGSSYGDIVQEIFGVEEETGDKKEIIQMKSNEIKNTTSINVGKPHRKIIMVSIDDVMKEKLSIKSKDTDIPESNKVGISYLKEQDFPHSKEDVLFSNKEGKVQIKQENEIYFIEHDDDDDDICRDSNEKDNVWYNKAEQDQIHSNENSENDQDVNLDILEMERNQDRNVNNIQIVTIDDVINTDKRKRGEITTVLSVEDVLKVKARPKKIKTSSDPELSHCNICESTFDNKRKLMLHKLRIHNPNWEEKFKCHICDLQCRTMSAHRHHLAKHENKRYPCNLCDKTYLSKSKTKEHILRVHEKKMDNKYLCTECGKGFKFSNALEYHMNKHSNSRNFICRYCGFASIAASALKRHERTHTGERPYQCKHCKKTFAGAAEKQKHEFGHEGVFRYKCKYCQKPFIQTYNMKVHWMKHRGPYVCEICNRNFADAEILKFHYAHSHRIKDVIIEDVDELDEDGDDIVE